MPTQRPRVDHLGPKITQSLLAVVGGPGFCLYSTAILPFSRKCQSEPILRCQILPWEAAFLSQGAKARGSNQPPILHAGGKKTIRHLLFLNQLRDLEVN